MSYVDSSSTFFIPGLKGLTKGEREHLKKNSPDSQLHDGGLFFHNGLEANYYISRAAQEKAVVVGTTGIKTQNILSPSEVTRLNDAGITLIWMALPHLKEASSFIKDSEELCRAFLTSPRSPATMMMNSDVPRFIATHSTSGAILLKLLHEDDTRRKLTASFTGAAYIAPFFDVPFASHNFSPKIASWQPLKTAFERYAHRHPNEPVGSLWFVKQYMKIAARKEGFKDIVNDETEITFSHILAIRAYSKRTFEGFDVSKASALNSIVIVGSKDSASCRRTTEDFANKISAEFFLAKGAGHDPIHHSPRLLEEVIRKTHGCAEAQRQRNAQIQLIDHTTYHVPKEKIEAEIIPFPPQSLSDRLRISLQRGTGTLNAAASFF